MRGGVWQGQSEALRKRSWRRGARTVVKIYLLMAKHLALREKINDLTMDREVRRGKERRIFIE